VADPRSPDFNPVIGFEHRKVFTKLGITSGAELIGGALRG
jgi:hypothetical protein